MQAVDCWALGRTAEIAEGGGVPAAQTGDQVVGAALKRRRVQRVALGVAVILTVSFP